MLRSPEVAPRFAQMGLEVVASTPAEFSAHLKNELDKWASWSAKGAPASNDRLKKKTAGRPGRSRRRGCGYFASPSFASIDGDLSHAATSLPIASASRSSIWQVP